MPPLHTSIILRSVCEYQGVDQSDLKFIRRCKTGEIIYLATQCRLADVLREIKSAVALYQPDTKRRRNEIFDWPLHALNHIVSIHDGLNVLSNSRVRTFKSSYDCIKNGK